MCMDEGAYFSERPFAVYYERANEKVLLPHILASAIRQIHLIPKSVLDIGCNNGRFAAELLRLLSEAVPTHCYYTGVDPCESALKRFRYDAFPRSISIELRSESAEEFLSGRRFDKRVTQYELT